MKWHNNFFNICDFSFLLIKKKELRFIIKKLMKYDFCDSFFSYRIIVHLSMKYILVTGGVISGIGKGIISSSIGTILRSYGFRVTSIKVIEKKRYLID
jgi:2-phosphoglycerate kinase